MYVELKNINKTYGSYQASRNVNFGIEKGKLIGLLGPSGSGKTTILRMIAGLETPDSGEVIIDGKVVNDVPASQRGIGFVFQNYNLVPILNVYENIILPLEELKQITIRRKEITTNVVGRSIEILEESELMKQFYEESCDRYLNLQFCTPTAFKRDGKYVNYPDLRLVYGSLMRKYSAASEELDMYDEETLEELVRNSEIIRYRLQTMPFPLEKVQINGFVGNASIKIKGTETLANYIRLLCRFGEYSGVGIKTSMGMGAMQLHRREKHG